MSVSAGTRLGPYEIVAAIGAGGMGEVYRARDTRLEREVAVKVLSRDLTGSPLARERFQREARTIAALHHPHICAIYDVGETPEQQAFIVMELLQGDTLEARLRQGPFPLTALLHAAPGLADALAAAHAAGIVHRDLKPANVVLTAWGPKLLDFGIAKTAPPIAEASAATETGLGPPMLTAEGSTVGTLAYMSPEQLRGEAVDARTDLFSLGLVLFQMATGRPAFAGATAAAVAAAILHEAAPPPSTLRPELPARFDEIILKALEKDRTLRYATAADLRTDLQRLTRDTATSAPPATGGATAAIPARRGGWWTAAGALLVIAAMAGGMWYARLPHRPAPLTDKETVVLASFANATGDPVFDGTLRQGLSIQLQQSPFLGLASDTRIQQLLRLMGQPAGATLTPAIAREICERLGGGAVLDGSIAGLGTQYVLGVRATGCGSGDVLGEEQEQVARKEDVLTALSGIASRLRVRLGESLATLKEHNRPLPDLSTASLDALKAYSTGLDVRLTDGQAAAIEQFKRAIAIDEGFAVAHARLGTEYSTGGQSELAMIHTTRAYELRDRATEDEKFFITATYHRQVTGNLELALQAFDLWAQTYPRTFTYYGLASGFVTKGLGRYEGCIERAAKAEAADPQSQFGYLNAAVCYMYLDRLDDAAQALRRAADRGVSMPDLPLHAFRLAFLRGDEAAMARERVHAQGTPSDARLTLSTALALAQAGQVQRADVLARRAVDLAQQDRQLERAALFQAAPAVWHALMGDVAEARRTAALALEMSTARDVSYAAAVALALTGELSRSQALITDLAARFPQDTTVQISYLPALRGLVALKQGQLDEALTALEPAAANEFALPATAFLASFGSLYPAYVRGLTLMAARQPAEAALEFQKIISHRGLVAEDPIDALARLQQARALSASGDRPRARAAYEDFLARWAHADANAPLVTQARTEAAALRSEVP